MSTDGQEALAAFSRSGRAVPASEEYGRYDRRQRKMAKIDALPAPLKAVVHDFGWLTVKTFMEDGVTDAKAIRRLIHVVLHEHSNEYKSRFQQR
jgi:hypothetical protein